ncbi:metal ABC transporter solute-binding protein, Zn/Mn family [Lacticaseibacillus kribbianus]|uniref:metal ABC transporter solute-binding protein, Zn/Mn family n=1 Tax=Lacticaseibacillus kribbianus TaxID=2926292 RepID=UPI001CD6889A|nr:zinc ABC transporter substrate-binding protein [Lacticaseibacillus kribbianus]
MRDFLTRLRRLGLVLIALVAAGALAGCGQTATPKRQGLQVVTTVDFYADVARAVLGDHGTVTAVINRPDIDPHDYEPTVNVAKTVAAAQVVLKNGAGYDDWMDRLTAADGAGITTVSAAKVVGIKDGDNEHIWYKPDVMPELARALAKVYGQKDPEHKAAYRTNAEAYIRRLSPLTAKIASLKKGAAGQAVAVSEPVFDNALSAMGYRIVNNHFAQAIEEGTDPSPADIRALEAAIEKKDIAFFVQNTQADSKVVTNIVKKVRAAGIPVLQVTETMPAHTTYTSWMMQQYDALAKIQRSNGGK